jgi:hypothetical protein
MHLIVVANHISYALIPTKFPVFTEEGRILEVNTVCFFCHCSEHCSHHRMLWQMQAFCAIKLLCTARC